MDATNDENRDATTLLPQPVICPDSALPHPAEPLAPILDRLLGMADGYRCSESPKQAMELYFELAELHGETREGRQARDRLMEMAEEYQRQGMPRQARSMYERLLQSS